MKDAMRKIIAQVHNAIFQLTIDSYPWSGFPKYHDLSLASPSIVVKPFPR